MCAHLWTKVSPTGGRFSIHVGRGMVIQSLGKLVDVRLGWVLGPTHRSLTLYDQYNYDYATL